MIITSLKHLSNKVKIKNLPLISVTNNSDSLPPEDAQIIDQFIDCLNDISTTDDFIDVLIEFGLINPEISSFCNQKTNVRLNNFITKIIRKKLKLNECLKISLFDWVRKSDNIFLNEQLCELLDSPGIIAQHLKSLCEKGLLINNDKRLLQPEVIAHMPPSFIRQQFASQTLQAAMLKSIAADMPKAVNNLMLSGLSLKRDKGFQLPWLHTCVFNDSVKVAKLLIRWGADINMQDSNGIAPIHIAVKENHFQTLKILLSRPNLDLNIRDVNGNTAIIIAANYDSWDCLNLLLDYEKVDINVENSAGKSLLSFLLFSEQEQILSKAIKHAKLFIKPKHLINSIHRDNRFVVAEILKKEPTLLKECESEVLAVTVSHGHTNILNCLIENGVNINKQDSRGCTPLHIACEYSHPHIVEVILACTNVDLTLLDYKSQNVLSIANLAAESALNQIENSTEVTAQKTQRLINSQTVLTLLNNFLTSMYL